MNKSKKEEILKKAIEKAVKGGFNVEKFWKPSSYKKGDNIWTWLAIWHNQNTLIFSHDFAKAFFGSSPVLNYESGMGAISEPAWQYHLKHMVLYSEPITYLTQFI